MFKAKYVGYIIRVSSRRQREATANFINEGYCLVSRHWAITIKKRKEYYRAETPVFLGQEELFIDSAFYKGVTDGIAAFWGILKVSYKI